MAARHARSTVMKKLSASISELLNIQKRIEDTPQTQQGSSGLHQAALMGNTKLVQLLLQRTLFADLQDGKGMTPLHYAACQTSTDVASILLKNGARTDVTDLRGRTPMHIACQNGLHDMVALLFYYRGDAMCRDENGKTPFDLACEYGRTKVVTLLLDLGLPLSMFNVPTRVRHASSKNNRQTTALHLACRNGHLETIKVLLEAGWDPNQTVFSGSPLHEAATHAQLDVIYLLIQCGADPSLTNGTGHTAQETAKKSMHHHKNPTASKEIRSILKEATDAVYGRALVDYTGLNSDELCFQKGQIIWILDRSDSQRWRGVLFGHRFQVKTGTFPAAAVQIVEKPQALGMQRSVSQRQAKKVPMPTVPDMGPNSLVSAPPMCRQSTSSYGSMEGLTSSPMHCYNGNVLSGISEVECRNGNSPVHQGVPNAPEVVSSPRHRNSTGSNSSQASSGFESMKSASQAAVNTMTQVHTLRGDSPPSRNSIHSSSSGSLGSSMERLDESGYASQVNICQLINHGMPDHEVMAVWLHDLRYEEYLPLFISAGYDLATLVRMSPEDLTAIGITKPGHRKRLTTEIHKLQIQDYWPKDMNISVRDWLYQLNLAQYMANFESQGFTQMTQIIKLSWEDYEDMGITKLGHLKKLTLAVRKLKEHRSGSHSTPVHASNGEVLLLASRTAEVKPYSHLASPQHLRTFQSPDHVEYSSGTFPRRSSSHPATSMQHSMMVTTEATVHAPSRPTVTVRPQPVAKITAKTKRCSGEIAGDLMYLDSAHLYDAKKGYPVCPKSPLLCRDDFVDTDVNAIRLNLHSPSKLLSKCAPPPPPKKVLPPPAPSQLTVPLSLGTESDLSPASSIDDFPPPPSPLQCEASIRNLRSIMVDPKEDAGSRSSTSSAEAMPFANDNCGTIRAKDGARPPLGTVFSQQNNSQANQAGGDVLNDIGNMLQNLTDQLDAMLYDPNRPVPTT